MTTNHTPLQIDQKRDQAAKAFLVAMRGIPAKAVRVAMCRMGAGVFMGATKQRMAAAWARGQHPREGRQARTHESDLKRIAELAIRQVTSVEK